MIFLWKRAATGFEPARQAATIAKRHDPEAWLIGHFSHEEPNDLAVERSNVVDTRNCMFISYYTDKLAGLDDSFVSTEPGGTRFESRSGRIFVIVVVHTQCSKLLKGLECTVLPMVLCTIKNPFKSFENKSSIVPASGFFLSRYFCDCAESDVKQYWPTSYFW